MFLSINDLVIFDNRLDRWCSSLSDFFLALPTSIPLRTSMVIWLIQYFVVCSLWFVLNVIDFDSLANSSSYMIRNINPNGHTTNPNLSFVNIDILHSLVVLALVVDFLVCCVLVDLLEKSSWLVYAPSRKHSS